MTDQNDTTTAVEDDDLPTIKLNLRNISGDSPEIMISTPILGTAPYVLIRPEDDAFHVEASHLSTDELVQGLAFVVGTLLQSDEVSQDAKESVFEFIEMVAEGDDE